MARASSSGLSSVLRGGAETIVARATAPGRAALAMVRLSGPAVEDVLREVCPRLRMDRPWQAQLASVKGRDGRVVDQGVVIPYRRPRSFTGEDMAEMTGLTRETVSRMIAGRVIYWSASTSRGSGS